MQELTEFAREMFAVAAEIALAMEAAGLDVEPDHEVPTVWIGDLGEGILACLGDLPADTASEVFAVIERWIPSGPSPWGDVLCTGLLEVLAGGVSAGRLDPARLAALLGPESRAYIDAWDEFTMGRRLLPPH